MFNALLSNVLIVHMNVLVEKFKTIIGENQTCSWSNSILSVEQTKTISGTFNIISNKMMPKYMQVGSCFDDIVIKKNDGSNGSQIGSSVQNLYHFEFFKSLITH